MRRRHALLCCLPFLSAALAAGDGPPAGPYSDGRLTVRWTGTDGSGGYTGTITLDGHAYPAVARLDGPDLRGTFTAGGTAYPFTETVDGDAATLTSGDKTYALRRGPRPADAGAATGGGTWHVRKVSLTDVCFSNGRDVPAPVAVTMLLPVGWSAKAHSLVSRVADCNFTPPRLCLFAHDADGTAGVTVLPAAATIWSDNPQVVRAIQAANQQFGQLQTSTLVRPRDVAAALREFVAAPVLAVTATGDDARPMTDVRPVGDPEPVPGVDAQVREAVRRANADLAGGAARLGVAAPAVAAQAGRQRFTATLGGHPVEGWLGMLLTTRRQPLPDGQGNVFVQDAPLVSVVYAPAGRLDGDDRMFAALLDTVQPQPQWQQTVQTYADRLRDIVEGSKQRVNDIENQMVVDNIRTSLKIAAIQRGTADYATDVRGRVAANRADALSHSAQQFALYAGDQAVYRDPTTGDRVQVPGGYAHAWASTVGNETEIIMTDSPSYDPNGHVGSGSWSEMQPER